MNKRHIANVSVMVNDYDEAITYYREKLGFRLVEDTPIGGDKRFVRMSPGESGPCILLAIPVIDEQKTFVGNQTGDRVFLFLHTDDFWRDFENLKQQGVELTEEPRHEVYGTVVVFRDLYGNLWDLVQPLSVPDETSEKINDKEIENVLPGLTLLPDKFTVHRLAAHVVIPPKVFSSEIFSVTRTQDELSIVCSEKISIESESQEKDWCCIKVAGPLDFALTGILAHLSQVLAEAEISLFAISTFDTDYLLVKSNNIEKAKLELVSAGYLFDK
jgi:catechol 2,3-dioxygenase-like lactoylglutathione lyase family enzyme